MQNFLIGITIILTLITSQSFAQDYCQNRQKYYDLILNEVDKKNPRIIDDLPECLKQDRQLIFKAILIDPTQFQNASEALHHDKIFIKRALKANSEILKYCAPEIKADSYFMEDAIYINRDSLKYSSWNLLDNKSFMTKMIDLDAQNYRFASDRLKSMAEFAKIALEDNGAILEFAPPNVKASKEFVKTAIRSNRDSIKFAHPKIANDEEFATLAKNPSPLMPIDELEKFLITNYTSDHSKKNLGKIIVNQGKFFAKNQIINRNFVVKWNKSFNVEKIQYGELQEQWRLYPVKNRNYNANWRNDLKDYPDLIKKIDRFFGKRKIAKEVIDNLNVTYLWKIKDEPLTIAFNLYDLYPATDISLSTNFSNITSYTAIASLINEKWQISIVDVIFNREIKIDPLYQNGHKKYIVWDLISQNEKDTDRKILFKVEDMVSDYFEIYQEQLNGKYRPIYQSKSLSN